MSVEYSKSGSPGGRRNIKKKTETRKKQKEDRQEIKKKKTNKNTKHTTKTTEDTHTRNNSTPGSPEDKYTASHEQRSQKRTDEK